MVRYPVLGYFHGCTTSHDERASSHAACATSLSPSLPVGVLNTPHRKTFLTLPPGTATGPGSARAPSPGPRCTPSAPRPRPSSTSAGATRTTLPGWPWRLRWRPRRSRWAGRRTAAAVAAGRGLPPAVLRSALPRLCLLCPGRRSPRWPRRPSTREGSGKRNRINASLWRRDFVRPRLFGPPTPAGKRREIYFYLSYMK